MVRVTRRTALAAAGAAAATGAAAQPAAARPATLYGHRGASALRPEHTLGAYAKAIADGADFIEPDLVSTKDGVLVARHEPNLTETTDVADRPEFASRRRTQDYEGRTVSGWWTTDFTLPELKTLRCKERLGKALRPESAGYDGDFQVVTWEEMIDFAAAESAARGRRVGLVPELKSPAWHRAQGHDIEGEFLRTVAAHPYTRRLAPLHVQCFEVGPLQRVRAALGRADRIRLVQLVGGPGDRPQDRPDLTYGAMTSPAGLREVATYADVVAPSLRGVLPVDAQGRLAPPNTLVRDAHAAGLGVVVWTFRPENRFLPADLRDGAPLEARNPAGSLEEMRRFLELGVDGFFTDDPALGRRAIDAFQASRKA